MNSLLSPVSYPAGAVYTLLARQIKSYQRRHRLGDSTSVPTELARELLGSIRFTLMLAGEGSDPEAAFSRGQEILKEQLAQTRSLCGLLTVTGDHRNHWRWDAMTSLERYLERYDPYHLAQRVPEDFYYPLPLAAPELPGIFQCRFYADCLWQEDQILAAFAPCALEELYDALPIHYWEAPESNCEQPLINALGRVLLDLPLSTLLLTPEEKARLAPLAPAIETGADALCAALKLPPAPAAYARQILDQARARWSSSPFV